MNKKILSLLLSGILLVGCSSVSNPEYTSSVVDGDEVVVIVNGVEVSKNDIYHYMLTPLGSSSAIETALAHICELEITDAVLIEEKIMNIISNYSDYIENGNIDDFAVAQGYVDQQDYIDSVIAPQVKKDLLKSNYIELFFDSIINEYQPKYIKLISFEDEEEALEALETLTSEEDFDMMFDEKQGYDYGMVTTKGGIDESIIAKFDDFNEEGIYGELILDDYGSYVIVYVYNNDIDNFREIIIEDLGMMGDISTAYQAYYLDLYNFSVYENYLDKVINN